MAAKTLYVLKTTLQFSDKDGKHTLKPGKPVELPADIAKEAVARGKAVKFEPEEAEAETGE